MDSGPGAYAPSRNDDRWMGSVSWNDALIHQSLLDDPIMDELGDVVGVAVHHQHVRVAFDAHGREIEHIGLAAGRHDGLAVFGRRDRQALPDRDLVAEIAPHDEMRHALVPRTRSS